MEKYLKLAFEHLEAVNVGDERKKVLIGLSHELMGREVWRLRLWPKKEATNPIGYPSHYETLFLDFGILINF